jgi:hypothetical protein
MLRPYVGDEIGALSVFVIPDGPAGFKYVAGINSHKAVLVNAQHLGVSILRRTGRKAQPIFEIEDPRDDALGVLPQQGTLTRGNLHFVEVMPGRVAVVQAYVERVGFRARHGINPSCHAFHIGQVARGWNILTCDRAIRRIDGVDVEVFITGLVLRKQNVLAVAAPEVQVNGRAVSAVIGLALAKGSVVRLTQMLRVPLKGLMKAMNTPSGEI